MLELTLEVFDALRANKVDVIPDSARNRCRALSVVADVVDGGYTEPPRKVFSATCTRFEVSKS
jgi:hypothetical protein